MPNSVMDATGVQALATMPSRDELLAKLLGTMQAPIATFVRTLNEVPTKFVRGLAAVREQREKGGEQGGEQGATQAEAAAPGA
jgi:large subunit ribosomal protein L10